MDVPDLINVISADERFLIVPSTINTSYQAIVICHPTLKQRNYANFLREQSLAQSKEAGVLTEKEVLTLAKEAGAWSDAYENTLSEANEDIARLEGEKAIIQHSVVRQYINRQIRDIKNRVIHIRRIKEELLCQSAEYLSQLEYIYYLMRQNVKHVDGLPLWNSEVQMLACKEDNLAFFNWVATQVANEGMLSIKEIRSVARSAEWRLLWSLSRENLSSLFNRPITDFSLNQKSLIYWSKVYDIAFESYEKRPSDEVIQDDERFDEWLHRHLAERSENNTVTSSKPVRFAKDHQEQGVILDGYYLNECNCGVGIKPAKGLGLKPRHADTCKYGMFVRYTPEQKSKMAQEIYGRNPGAVRAVLGKEQKVIQERGLIEEKKLRGKNTRKILGMPSRVHPRRR